MAVYTEELKLSGKDVNMFGKLRTSRLFEMMQDIAGRHFDSFNIPLEPGIAWVLSRQRVEIQRLPEDGEQLRLETWPGVERHGLYPRYYRFMDSNGEAVINASAYWALMDSVNRCFFSGKIELPVTETGTETGLPRGIKKLSGEHTENFTVPFSYVDINQHMNNCRYFDLAENFSPLTIEGREVKEITVEYARELKLHESVELRWGIEGDSYCCYDGEVKSAFKIKMDYK